MRSLDYKSQPMLDVEKRFGESIEEILHRLYIEEYKSAQEIGVMLGVSHVAVNKWLLRLGIKRRLDWKKIIQMAEERKQTNE